MTRRNLIMAIKCEAPRCPVEEVRLNAFAEEYNAYVERLRAGNLDIKQWDRVLMAWERLK